MRVAHCSINVAGFASRLAEGQRKLRHETLVLSRPTSYNFPADVQLPATKLHALIKTWRTLRDWQPDVIHVHGGMWWMDGAYVTMARRLKAKLAVHYHGFETRTGVGFKWQRYADVLFYGPPDLRTLLPARATWTPQPIDTEAIQQAPMPQNDKPVFVHFTTSETNKGTSKVIEMFNRAFSEGGAELRTYSQMRYSDVLNIMRAADVVIDQVAPFGIYGTVSVEAMALGRPVLATLDRSLYPIDCPVIWPRATKLMELARDVTARLNFGRLGRNYVERVHDSQVVAQKVLDTYATNL